MDSERIELKENAGTPEGELKMARDEFVAQWGVLGAAWGINRTMAQIHALLLVTPGILSTDDVMEQLQISRGNAHTNLRELATWGLIRSVVKRGDRKEYFEAEKDVWKMFSIIVRERKRREIRPAIQVLKHCMERTETLKSPAAQTFHAQTKSLCEFVEMADQVLTHVARADQSTILPWALRLLK